MPPFVASWDLMTPPGWQGVTELPRGSPHLVRYADRKEVYKAGDVYHAPAGHLAAMTH